MHDDGAVGPLGNSGGMSAERDLIIGPLRGTKILAEEDDLRSDWPAHGIDANAWNKLQRNGITHRILNRRTTRTVRQGIGRGQSNHHIARYDIRGNLDFNDVVLPATWPDDYAPDLHIVDSKHCIGVARAGREAEM